MEGLSATIGRVLAAFPLRFEEGSRSMRVRQFALLLLACAGEILSGSDAALSRADQVLNMRCKLEGTGIVQNVTIDLAAKTVSGETFTPNPGASPDPSINRWNYADPALQVTDQDIDWTEPSSVPNDAVPWSFSLNRYTGSLHVTKAPGGVWPNGQDVTFTCEKRQKQF